MSAEINNSMQQQMLQMGNRARQAVSILRNSSARERSLAIEKAALAINKARAKILRANANDMQKARQKGLPAAFLDRLFMDEKRITAMADTIEGIAKQPDPLGRELATWQMPNGLVFRKTATPLGVIGIIYESRPNVTADAAALCLRSGNAAILRGGSDALATSKAVFMAMQKGFAEAGLPDSSVQLVDTADRDAVGEMLKGLGGALDLVIPRGGKSLVARVQNEARIPVLSHLEGICHVYVHADADPAMAVEVGINAKMRRVGICGAAECMLVDAACAPTMIPLLASAFYEAECELRGDAQAQSYDARVLPASHEDWGMEYLAPILAIRVVAGLQEAMDHIACYGSGHTESILTENRKVAREFQAKVDSSIVLHNASTQFADGGEFGFGAEIGIATGRLHARGPVGAAQLTSYKYQVDGNGQIRPLG